MTFVSLFAGIGGIDLALERSGAKCVLQCEIDPACNRVLAHHWPNIKRVKDVTKLKGERGSAELVCGGWPCQGNSVAGKRGGMADERSGLFHELIRVLDEVAARWFLGENVPGILSVSSGEDWALVLEMLTGYHPRVPESGWQNSGFCKGPKRSAAWCVLDAQHFGVPQRRHRVFIVADTGRGAGPLQVLFEPESCSGDSPPSREAWTAVADTITRSFAKHHGASAGKDSWPRNHVLARCVAAGEGRRYDGESNTFIASTLRSRQHSAGVNMPGRGGEDDQNLVYQCHGTNVGPMGTLRQGNGDVTGGVPFVTHTLRSEGADASEDGTGRGVPIVFAENQRGEIRTSEQSMQLTTGGGKPGQGYPAVLHGGVRRLTPLECERLQGLPDGWTIPAGSDSARYRAIGNSVAVPCVEWIGRRIMESEPSI